MADYEVIPAEEKAKAAPVKPPVVVDDADDFLAELSEFDATVVHEETFELPNGTKKAFLVKEFNQDDHLEVALGPLTFINNEYVKKPKIEAKLSVAIKIQRGIVKVSGKDKAGRATYEPLFTVPQIEKMYSGNAQGRFLDWSLAQVHKHNPNTNPLAKKKPSPSKD